jgi:hypothetical protein
MSPAQQTTQQPQTQQEMTPIAIQASGVVTEQPVKFPQTQWSSSKTVFCVQLTDWKPLR